MTLIEIGSGEGGSLQLWKQYLGPYARIVGLDIRPECKEFEEDQIYVRIGDQSDDGFLLSVIDEFGPAQIVIDDGSHQMDHIAASFRCLYPKIAPDGVYFVEDLHTAYWEQFGGGLRRPGSFIEISKNLIDELNVELGRGSASETEFSKTTLSIHFYESVVVFEKGNSGRKYALRTGKGQECNQLRRKGQECDQLRQQINLIQTSISWRLTWPLRWLHVQATRARKALRYP
jgi:hypothetical protein